MKYSRRFVGVLAVALISLPFLASALSIDELNQQIASLLTQVAALQQKIAGQAPTSASTGTQVSVTSTPTQNSLPVSVTSCPQLSRSLGLGARGDDVLSLQGYLIGQQLLSADSATGYFGALTQSAVQNWQSSHGVVTSGDPITTGFGMVGGRTRSLIAINCSLSVPSQTPTTPTTAFSCPAANPPASNCSVGWKPIKDSSGCTIAYDCATPLPTITPAPVTPTTPSMCPLMTRVACEAGQHYESYNPAQYFESAPGCKVENKHCVPDGTGGAPVITAVDGPANLGTNQAGTWVVRASVPNQSNAAIRYSVKWGDEMNWAYSSANGAAPASSAITTSGTFTHTFNYGGNFTPVFTVSNDSGSASFTTSVQVSGGLIICPIYAQSSMAVACPVGQHWESSKPTYDANNCPMQYSGKCVPDVGACTLQQLLCPAGQHVVYNGCQQSCVSDSNSLFSASPTSGAAPLAVNFAFSNITTTKGYSIDFGDGSTGDVQVIGVIDCFSANCGGDIYGASHTYTSAGTYTAKLKKTTYNDCQASLNTACAAWVSSTGTIGTVTITVGGSTSGTPSISVSASPSSVRQSSYQAQNGDTLVASWSAQNMPNNSSVGIALYDDKGTGYGYIGLGKSANGTINWTVPGSNCDSTGNCAYLADSPSAWYTKPGTYRLVGQIYTPSNACFGFCPAPGPTFVATGYSSWFTITQ